MKKILLFETCFEDRELLKSNLSNLGCKSIRSVFSEEQLIALIKSNEFDYAIIEYDALSSIFIGKPYLLNVIAKKTKLIFITGKLTALMKILFKGNKLDIYDKYVNPEELYSRFDSFHCPNNNGVVTV